MRGLFSLYAFSLKLASYIAVVSLVWAVLLGIRDRSTGRPAARSMARVLAAGAVAVIAVATALPRDWPPRWGEGDLAIAIGSGGLSDWRVIIEDPNSLAAVLLVANVFLYVPLAAFWTLGWSARPGGVLLGCLALSMSVELTQLVALEGVASTDDILLNVSGAVIGAPLGAALRRS